MKKSVMFLFALLSMSTQAQNLLGRWVAVPPMSEKIDEFTLNSFKGGVYTGESYDESFGGEYCRYTFMAKYDPVDSLLLARDKTLIEKTPNHLPVVYNLKYKKKGDKEYLIGYGQRVDEDGNLGGVFRAVYTRSTVEPEPKKKEVSPEEVAAVKNYKETRKNPVKASLRLKNPKIKLKIHDYGQQDHDSISVIYNDQLIAYKIPINSENQEFEVELQQYENNQLTFIAHNLGDVAPNTTYVEILADDKVFKYTLFTDLQKNAVINLKLNKK